MKSNDPMYLLFIEPTGRAKKNAKLAKEFKWFQSLVDESPFGIEKENVFKIGQRYRGFHECVCGEIGHLNKLLPNRMITNELAYHYIVYHSEEIPEIEWFKLKQLELFLKMRVRGK